MTMSNLHTIRLPSNRVLAYACYGDPNGWPVFYFHGLPASRLEGVILHEAALNNGCWIIAPERPGFGHSEAVPERTLLDWPDAVVALADALGISRFAVVGMSAGGPYALACAWKAGQRTSAVAVAGGLGPCHEAWAVQCLRLHGRAAFTLTSHAPALLWPSYGLLTWALLRYLPRTAYSVVALSAPAADRKALQRSDIKPQLLRSMTESMRQGPHPALQELALLARPWGFDLIDIRQPVDLWHGDADQVVPLRHAQHYASELPKSALELRRGEGHFSLPINWGNDILAKLRTRCA